MQIDSDLVIYRTTLVRTFQVVTICRVDKSELLSVLGFDPVSLWGWCLFACVCFQVTMVSPLVVELIQLVVHQEMPPRCRGRGRGQFQEEFEDQNEEVQRIVPRRGRDRKVEIEVDKLAAHVDDMELVMARFQQMNPQTFNGDEPSSDA
ncbi:hypothetical protein F511_21633 [Dorcoceras hygrometricum]|uniref:Uncharacterized protein n=1 Tax=Dorcoceras hygrometricum TaxID=472368 RepID=A0A2Z7AX97_9LAMI|nr:hypothetical protein F511_21633 [Dorcoceras hygrometricum]